MPEVRLSINLNAQTIEKVIGRRKKLLEDMGKNMAIEVSAALSGSGFEDASVKMLNESLDKEALARENVRAHARHTAAHHHSRPSLSLSSHAHASPTLPHTNKQMWYNDEAATGSTKIDMRKTYD